MTLSKDSKKIIRYKGEILSLILVILISFAIAFFLLRIDIITFAVLFLFFIFYIRLTQGQLLGSALQISETQFSRVYSEALECSKLLGLKKMPPIYVTQDPKLNAFAIGFGRKNAIVLHSSIVEKLSIEEIRTVIAHEMGHILFSHTSLLSLFAPLGSYWAISELIVGFWARKAEYTCDRCALICSKDRNTLYSTFVKIAIGPDCSKYVDISKLSSQLQELNKSKIGSLAEVLGSHPYLLKRLWRISQFSTEYNIIPCPHCGSINKNSSTHCMFCNNEKII